MTTRPDDAIGDWLDAEGAGADDRAEAALTRALAGLGRRGPREGFADRVLLAAGVLEPAHPARWPATVRVALAACLLVAGVAFANLPVLVAAFAPVVRALGLSTIVPALHWLAHAMGAAFASWTFVEEVASALRASLASAAVVMVLAANLLVATASLIALKRLLNPPEELLPW
jgi:hypothetical protein